MDTPPERSREGLPSGPEVERSVKPVGRFAASLREMRWTLVLLELLLLVAGILIALAVDGWIEDRRDARAEHQYLERLVRDFDQDLDVLQEFVEFEERQAADAALAYRPLCGGVAVADREQVARALDHLTTRRTVRLVRATYSDLLATGNLRLIRDAGLRDRIVTLYEANERWSAVIDRNNQIYVDQMYLMYMMDVGLVSPRPDSNLPRNVAPREEFARRLGLPAPARADRLWSLAADAPERDVLCGKLWYRGYISVQAFDQARTVAAQVSAVRQEVADELAGGRLK
jgi:hypothetical protein